MQILCFHCHKPFALNRETMHTALDELQAQGQSHYDAPCPHCRRVNRVSKKELQHAAPDWRAKTTESDRDG